MTEKLEDIMKVANGKWPSILVSLGFTELAVSGKHGPCPICEGKDRFRFMKLDGPGRWICNQCGSNDAMNLVMEVNNMSFHEAAKMIRPMVGQADYCAAPKVPDQADIKRRTSALMDTWRAAKDRESMEAYLKGRGLPKSSYNQASLRCGSVTLWEDGEKAGKHPCMLARVTNTKNLTVALHKTYIMPEGKKIKRLSKTVGPMTGGAIRLFKLEGETLIVAEGIETAMAARFLYAHRTGKLVPAWATVSANGMRSLGIPKQIKKVIIMGDSDSSFTGQSAAYDLANRLVVKDKLEAEVMLPKAADMDWLDVLNSMPNRGEFK